jgi:hypothetical protein
MASSACRELIVFTFVEILPEFVLIELALFVMFELFVVIKVS